jgi:peptidoglycan DL-endopeptidase LytE
MRGVRATFFVTLRRESMKGSFRAAILFTAMALIFCSISGIAKNAGVSSKSSVKHTKAKRSSQPAPKLKANSVYTVRRGDSLYGIARLFKTTPEALRSANKLAGSKIKIGQELKVPVAPVAAAKKIPQNELQVDRNEPFMTANVSQPDDQNKALNDDAQALRYRLADAGFEWIGVRYRFSGNSAQSGVDCSGLVKSLFSKFNIDMPRSSREQFKQGEKVDRDKLEVGDLVFFSSGGNLPTHVGIYVGNDRLLHAAQKARKVIVSDISTIWNKMRYLGARRIMDLWWEEPTPATPEKN